MRNLEDRSYQEIACILDIESAAAPSGTGVPYPALTTLLAADGLMDPL